ncbi:MAG: hypothetical protein ACREIT_11545, partial [Tepidisphaeraceae bacterium]
MRTLCLIIGMTLLVAGGAGCELPAQLVFSPDGTHAAWRVGDQAHLLDGDGKPLRPLGRSIGGFAWSADSQTLYFATATESAPPGHDVPAMSIERQWLDPVGPPASTQASTETTIVPAMPATATATTVATTAPATQAGGPDSAAIVQMLRGDTATPLFRLDWPVWHMALSPDGAWLA